MFNFFKKKPSNKLLSFYVDGSCYKNGKHNAYSGCAYYCLDTEHKQSLSGDYNLKHTNNTAELKAILYALKHAKAEKAARVRIYSDSEYSINSLSKWRLSTRWKNYDQIKEIKEMMKEFKEVSFEWIKGHHASKMNMLVDKLAYDFVRYNKPQ